jgi:hypothetical protein
MIGIRIVLASLGFAVAASSSACSPALAVPPEEPVVRSVPASAASSAPVATNAPSDAGSGPAPAAGAAGTDHRCELGVWDAAAHACAIPPRGATGDPGGWAGCTQAKGPQSSRCFTGTRWASARCECACVPPTRWNDDHHSCE